jgi:hypothetical protein
MATVTDGDVHGCLIDGDLAVLRRRLPRDAVVLVFRYHLPPYSAGFRAQFAAEFAVLDGLQARNYTGETALLDAIELGERYDPGRHRVGVSQFFQGPKSLKI